MAYEIKVWNGGNPSYNRQARTDTVRYIVVHYTADGKPDSHTAYNSMLYFSRANRDASAHFFIDDHDIYEFADPTRWSCWHVGDGKGAYGITNQNSVGIEVVQDENAPFSSEEVRKLTWLVQRLMAQFGVPASRVLRHYDASRKMCPWYYVPGGAGGDAAWKALHATITGSANAAQAVEATVPQAFGGRYLCQVGTLNVRTQPNLGGEVVAEYHRGQTVNLDDWYVEADGYVWGRYTGASSGRLRYVAVGRATGKVEPDDYLVRVG